MERTGETTGKGKKRHTETHKTKDKRQRIKVSLNITFDFLLLSFILFFSSQSNLTFSQELRWPEITREMKPWTRMWWPASIGKDTDITYNLQKYNEAGLGGIEVTCIYGVKGHEDSFVNYLSPEWMKKFNRILSEANRLGMGVDLANASGWPFGGPWVGPDDACRNINYKTFTLKEGQRLDEEIRFVQQPLMRPAGQGAFDQVRFEKPLMLHTLMAYSDSGEIIDLTGKVSPSGILGWTAPAGNWTLYALFEGWHGKQAERAGPGGEGDVIDHFSAKAIDDFLAHFDGAFSGYDLSTLRGYFNDSYEVDDASGQANWTDRMFEEFRLKRGYELREHLPALFRKDSPEMNARILSDYRQTVSDLILENFTKHWTAWANRQQKITRNQAHGSPGNILDLYAASDIPETEGYELTKLKFASSASNVTGKKYTSCEAATWLGEHFSSTLADVKNTADLFFLGGINHLFYHGTCFSPKDEPWPGFLFYAAVEFTPANSFWNDYPALNSYIARVQSFMQQGRSDNDILLYFPIFDRYADPGRGMLEHFDAISPAFRDTPFAKAADTLPKMGYAYDYVSDLQISRSAVKNKLIKTEGNTYSTLLLPGCKYIPLETFEKILKMAEEGAIILLYESLPENVSGFSDYLKNNEIFNRLKAALAFKTAGEHVMQADYGKGKVLMGDNIGELLSFAGIRREAMADKGIMFNRRKLQDGTVYFIKNTSQDTFQGWLPVSSLPASSGSLPVSSDAGYVSVYNPSTGTSGSTPSRKTGNGSAEIFMRINPQETFILKTSAPGQKADRYPFYGPSAEASGIEGTWLIKFTDGGPVLPESREIDRLISWTETGGDDVRNFSGTASYMINFKKPSGKADAYRIGLGKVCNSARIILNGEEITVLIGPDFSITVEKNKIKKSNTLEVRVSNLMANRIAWMDRNKIEWKKFYNVNFAARLRENNKNGIFDASAWAPVESGLIGPVTITRMREIGRSGDKEMMP